MTKPRTLGTMMALFDCAKLDPSLSAFVRPIEFTENLLSDEYKLFEVDPVLADEISDPNSSRVIELKDEPGKSSSGRVYACATERTYSVVETETSNTLLLIPNGSTLTEKPPDSEESQSVVVQALKASYLELHPCIAPSLRLLKQRMLSSKYHGPLDEDDCEENSEICDNQMRSANLTRLDLTTEFPCSTNELNYAFARLKIFEVQGFMRLVDPDYLIQVIRDIFFLADECAWDWRKTGFSIRKVIENLKDQHEPSVLKQIIGIYFHPRNTPTCTSSSDLSVFPRSSKICQLVGEQLLSVTNSFDLNDFKAVWKATVPSGLRPKLRKHLTCAGRAFCGTAGTSMDTNFSARGRPNADRNHPLFRTISLLRSEDLPDDTVESRLHALFERSAAWPELELASFLIDLVVPPDTSCKLHSDPVIGPLTFPCTANTDSDFEYIDELEGEFPESNTSTETDTPKPAPASVVTILSRLCRVTTVDQGRIYTEKYATI
ncbi:unnamed protein product [Echinostoma caproni]|uniref:Sister chromatid cohesion protein DCC1 n=1 Tax=Echinostoma caproni TaxID=27848 RepID=A0A183AH78_9TREM|nr:unnamed protein product [Echinostoma caproni]